ncbi:MAG: PLP-dependent aminotransferase family protein [Candidatus Sericytochromatia bacterium]
MNKEFAYIKLANTLQDAIEKGVYPVKSKMPSVRLLSKNNNLSVSTVLQSFYELENRGLIYAVEKSGYFVNIPINENFLLKDNAIYKSKITKINKSNLISSIFNNRSNKNLYHLSSSVLPLTLTPAKELANITKKLCNYHEMEINKYSIPLGIEELRQEIAKSYLKHNIIVSPDEVIITNGCMEGISLALRSIAKAGDIIAIESPTYFGFLQLIESLGIYALEIPTNPNTGIDLEAFKQLAKDFKIKACLVVPNFNNPLGSLMPEKNKQDFVEICNKYDLKIIESDVYSELYFENSKPKPLRYYGDNENTITCSSLSKTVSAGLRIGWAINKKYLESMEKLKYSNTLATPTLTQMIAKEFLKNTGYERYLNNTRKNLKLKMNQLHKLVSQNFSFSDEIKISNPKGGFSIWLKLPENIDSFDIYKKALEENISIVPGIVFSPSERHNNYIRLSSSFDYENILEDKIKILAKIIFNN